MVNKQIQSLPGTVKALRFYSMCKLTIWPVSVLWMLAEDVKLLGQRQRQHTREFEHGVGSISPWPPAPEGDVDGPRWMLYMQWVVTE